MRKILSIFIILMMIFTSSLSAFASPNTKEVVINNKTYVITILEQQSEYERLSISEKNTNKVDIIESIHKQDETNKVILHKSDKQIFTFEGDNNSLKITLNEHNRNNTYNVVLNNYNNQPTIKAISWGPWTKSVTKTSKAEIAGDVSFVLSALLAIVGGPASCLVSIATYCASKGMKNVWMKITTKERFGKNPACKQTVRDVKYYKYSNYTGYIDSSHSDWIHYY